MRRTNPFRMMRSGYPLFIMLLLLAAACQNGAEEAATEELARIVNVHLEEIGKEDFSSYIQLVGRVTSRNDVRVSAEVNGPVREIYRREGDAVRSGESVLKIDDRRLAQEVRRLEAMTRQSEENHERLRRLFEQERIGSEIEVLNARYTWEQNLAALEALRVDLEKTAIEAPFSGEIDEILVEQGEMVMAGTPVFRIINRSALRIVAGVPARYAGSVKAGSEAEVWFDSDPENRIRMPIVFVGNAIDPANRTFRIELEVPSGLEQVKIDMLARVELETLHLDDVIVINGEYIYREQESHIAWVASRDENGREVAERRVLQIGPSWANRVVVTGGLNPGDRLITTGSAYLQDQTRINPVESSVLSASDQ